MDKKVKELVAKELVKIARDLVGGAERDYLFLGRMQQDFDYALNERTPAYGQERHLMMLNFEDQLKEMKKLWNRVDEKPEWLTKRQIADYEKKIKKLKRSKVSKDLVSAKSKYNYTVEQKVKSLARLHKRLEPVVKRLSKLDNFSHNDEDKVNALYDHMMDASNELNRIGN